MRKIKKKFLFLLFLILISGFVPFNQDRNNYIDKSPIIAYPFDDEIDYIFIWDEFNNASRDIEGDDSLVFGPSLGKFHNYTEIKIKIDNLERNFPEFVAVFSIGTTYLGHEIYGVRITNEEIITEKSEFLIIAQHHAREQITVENSLFFIDKIINDTINQDDNIIKLLNEKELFVIPSLNIDGSLLISSFPWQRKNVHGLDLNGEEFIDKLSLTIPEIEPKDIDGDGFISAYYDEDYQTEWVFAEFEGIDLNEDGKVGEDVSGGVDPNRNYDHEFGNPIDSSPLPESQIYSGEYPFSENCTNNLKKFIEDHSFVTVVSLHSGIEVIYYPDVPTEIRYSEDYQEYENVTSSLENILGFIPLKMTFEAGLFTPWMYWKQIDNKIAICLETYGNSDALKSEFNETMGLFRQWGVWDLFNPAENKVIENSELIYNGLLFLAELYSPNDKKISGYDPFYFIMFFLGSIYVIKINKK